MRSRLNCYGLSAIDFCTTPFGTPSCPRGHRWPGTVSDPQMAESQESTMNSFSQAAEIDEEALKNARRGVPDGAFHQ